MNRALFVATLFFSTISQLSAQAELISVVTSGSAFNGDASLGFDVSFQFPDLAATGIPLPISLNYSIIINGTVGDSNRDAVRFESFENLTFEHNGVAFDPGWTDWNDTDQSYLFTQFLNFEIDSFDIIHVSGTATGGEFIFGNDPSTFTTFPSGDYAIYLSVVDSQGAGYALSGVPEPSTYALWLGGILGAIILLRRRK